MRIIHQKIRFAVGNLGFAEGMVTRDADRRPTHIVVLAPGYLDTIEYPHLEHHARTFAERGAAAVRVQPFGTWNGDEGARGYTLSNTMKTMNAAIGAVDGEDWIDADLPVIVVGHSFGGFASLMAAQFMGQEWGNFRRVVGAVALMPPSPRDDSNSLWSDATLDQWREKGYRESTRRHQSDPDNAATLVEQRFRVSYAFVEDVTERFISFKAILSNTNVPVLLIAGEEDTTNSPEKMRMLAEWIPNAECVALPWVGHDYRLAPRAIAIVDAYVSMWAESTLSQLH